VRGQAIEFAFAAGRLLFNYRHARAVHLKIEDRNWFAHDDRQIQLHGAVDLLLLASRDIGTDVFGHAATRSTDLVVTSRPASSFICSRPWSNAFWLSSTTSIGRTRNADRACQGS